PLISASNRRAGAVVDRKPPLPRFPSGTSREQAPHSENGAPDELVDPQPISRTGPPMPGRLDETFVARRRPALDGRGIRGEGALRREPACSNPAPLARAMTLA